MQWETLFGVSSHGREANKAEGEEEKDEKGKHCLHEEAHEASCRNF